MGKNDSTNRPNGNPDRANGMRNPVKPSPNNKPANPGGSRR